MQDRPITLLVCALGGEGGGVLAEWLVDIATACGHTAQSTSIPGVAQRTGATTYYLEFCPQPDAELGERRPVFGLSPVPGALDLLVSSELLEAARQAAAGIACAERTHVLSAAGRTLTTAEKLPLGDGRYDAAALRALVGASARVLHLFDLHAMVRRSGTAPSAVLLGAIAASGVLPFPREAYERVVREGGRGVEASLRGFDAAYRAVAGDITDAAPAPVPAMAERSDARALPGPASDFPAALQAIVALGHPRLVEYQDAAYADLYLRRVERVLGAERAADPEGRHAGALAAEAARWLALWMAYDDIVRVADLKSRASRFERVRREAGARPDELLRVYDHFKPGVPEFAALLPARLAAALQRWDRRRVARGREPFALALALPSHGIGGLLALRALAACKALRRRGSRWAEEQALIERWLTAVERGARLDWALGHEVACAGRLIKGYGTTNERGKANLLHIVDHLACADAMATDARATAIAAARTAALA
ncbi:MAG TPA: indolepyruvate oxidoreductase subunit beta family protein, partial [Burkholderiaceae bacterium]